MSLVFIHKFQKKLKIHECDFLHVLVYSCRMREASTSTYVAQERPLRDSSSLVTLEDV
jgi:hypothetical protein